MQYVPQLPQPSRMLVVPLLAAALGAGVATATFGIVNMEDQASVSLPPVQSAPPSDVLAGERSDGGPKEGTARQIVRPAVEPAVASPAPRYDGGPEEARAQAHSLSPEPSHAHDGLLQRRRR